MGGAFPPLRSGLTILIKIVARHGKETSSNIIAKKRLWGECSVLHGDVRAIDIEALPDVDGLMFGFPCNDFSIVGEHKGFDGEYGPLYSYGVKVLQNKINPNGFWLRTLGALPALMKVSHSRKFSLT